jgi:hypothetical protein
MKNWRLPSDKSAAWNGGFVLADPGYVHAIGVGRGTVVGAGEVLCCLLPGAAGFSRREATTETGDFEAVAVEPRRSGRIALAGLDSVTILEGRDRALVRFPQSHPEPVELAWGPSADGTPGALYVLLADGILLRLPPGTRVFEEMGVPAVRTIAADETGTMAFACFDDQRWELDVYVLEDARDGRCSRRTVEAPSFMGTVHLAVAGAAAAVSFAAGPVWISRGDEEPFREILEEPAGGPVTFQGSASDAALFAVARTWKTDSILRIEVGGAATCIGELDRSDEPLVRIFQVAWDASRSSLWAASGRAGILVTSPPGVPVPLGKDAPS